MCSAGDDMTAPENQDHGPNFCATCGDRVYRNEMARCEGCDKAPTFCTCLAVRRERQKRERLRFAHRAVADV